MAWRRLGCWLGPINQLCVTSGTLQEQRGRQKLWRLWLSQIAPARILFGPIPCRFLFSRPRRRPATAQTRLRTLSWCSTARRFSLCPNKRGAYTRHHGTLRDTADARAHIPMNAVDPASWFATRHRTQRARARPQLLFLQRLRATLGPRASSSWAHRETRTAASSRKNP